MQRFNAFGQRLRDDAPELPGDCWEPETTSPASQVPYNGEDDPEVEHTVMCPHHGEVRVEREYPTVGPDPYAVEVGLCGCHVMAFSADDVHVIKRTADHR